MTVSVLSVDRFCGGDVVLPGLSPLYEAPK